MAFVETYESIKYWKDQNMMSFQDILSLNEFHSQVMCKVFKVAIQRLGQRTLKQPPCEYVWFITGSGGRFEQGFISDQDQGIIYEQSSIENDAYFKDLGKEVSYGLFIVGYPYCQGGIMSSNPMWCKSIANWKKQLKQWMREKSWDTIRYLQIIYDARGLIGNTSYIHQLKSVIYDYHIEQPFLLKRFADNVSHIKNVIGPLGQLLVEQYGEYQGCINLKYAAFLPYVNTIRLLAIKEGIYQTSTVERIQQLINLPQYQSILQNSEKNFLHLLQYRISLFQTKTYTDTHYLNVEKLSIAQRKEIKQILKEGKILHHQVITLFEKGVHNGF